MATPALSYSRYCEGCAPVEPPALISSPEFLRQHYLGPSQLSRLARRRIIICKKFKGTNWIAINPLFAQSLGLEVGEIRLSDYL